MRFARYVRLFTDDEGQSRFEDLEIELTSQDFAPPAPPVNFSEFLPASQTFWIGTPGDWGGEVRHPSPQRMIYCTIEGEYEITAGNGEVRCFPAGSLLVIEDTEGRGHETRITNDRGSLVFAVAIADDFNGSRVV